MAEKSVEPKIILERTYNVPLRKGFQKAPKYRRTKKAINVLRKFLSKNMKSDNVKIGKYINLELWKDGIKNPPHHVKVNVTKDSEGVVRAELVGAPVEKLKKASVKKEKKEEKKPEDKIEQSLSDLEQKTEKIKQDKAEEAKVIEKEEVKEAKEQPKDIIKESVPKEAKKPAATDVKVDKSPKGAQKMEPHHGEGKQVKK